MPISKLLIANRGEIAIRIMRAAADLDLPSVALFSEDDGRSLHVRLAEETAVLPGRGAQAYLNIEAILNIAKAHGCDAIHPGYGFLSENCAFARACAAAGLTFVGPSPEALELFGDKARSRALAGREGIPILPGTPGPASLEEVQRFFSETAQGQPIMIKAVAGGGGRGMRRVARAEELPEAYASASREAAAAFGSDALFAERFVSRARHIEVQIAGDRRGVLALGDRDCSLQRRRQKIVEIAPAPHLSDDLRAKLWDAATTIAAAARFRTLGTVEFLLDLDTGEFAFIEMNARIQVEHPVTESVTGLDLVSLQLRLAAGETLTDLGLGDPPQTEGFAIQARVNLETMTPQGDAIPEAGVILAYEPPGGPGIRIDGYGYAGYPAGTAFDSLLAKVIVSGDTLAQASARADRALSEFRLEGPPSNIGFLRALLKHPDALSGHADITFLEREATQLCELAAKLAPPAPAAAASMMATSIAPVIPPAPAGSEAIEAPISATVGLVAVEVGDVVRAGQTLAVLEAMKMEHLVAAPFSGEVTGLIAQPGLVLEKGQPLLFLSRRDVEVGDDEPDADDDPDFVRPDLAEVEIRWAVIRDAARPDAVARRRRRNQRTARENIEDLVDPGSFLEYGAFALAAQRRRRSEEELLAMSPADGLICGLATVNADLVGAERARCAALAYDFTVLAGTQGLMNHRKTDRLLEVVEEQSLPVVWFAEGGGGRPGDTDGVGSSGLATPSFRAFARLAGQIPKIAIVSGRCFAGNAAFAGMSDIIIATQDANLGMGGPAMIEGGGLGVFTPEEIGPMSVQTRNGVVDILAEDEAEATRLAQKALGYFQGSQTTWSAPDPRALRKVVPENRLRVYDVRRAIEGLVDTGSFLELRPHFAPGLITGFARLEGRPIALIANDPRELGGAVDCDGADKASRHLQIADAFNLPVVSLIDTPGFMVGPDSEAAAAVRKTSRLFINAATLGVPMFAVVLRKAYGLGAQAMAGGSTQAPVFCVAWPSGEFGGMGLEGSVRLGYRRELEAQTDPGARQALFDKLLGSLYARGKAIQVAASLEIDAVIDPADTRSWILKGLASCAQHHRPSRRIVDAW